ncbi:hypothetical protein ACFFU9_01945 [Mariniflexile ostreae]|uniref:Flagellin-like protein n=1 Tax=Mariniflexile ostreae TaxID=1520892 RepID=A0ABV5F8N4_9FLAO
MENEKEDFEFVKEAEDHKKNYILKKDKITKGTMLFIIIILVLLGIAVVYSGMFFGES